MEFSNYNITIRYNLAHGKKNPITIFFGPSNIPVATNHRNFVLNLDLQRIGDHYPSAVTAKLFKPRSNYFSNEGESRPINKWGTYGIDQDVIPPIVTVVGGAELKRDAVDADFEISHYVNRYWRHAGSVAFHQNHWDGPDDSNNGWIGERFQHHLYYGFDTDWVLQFFDTQSKLRVSSSIESFGEKYLLLIIMWRGDRTIYAGYEFSLIGEPSAADVLGINYLPTSIVYSPPGQDMYNSLIETENYGTRFTINSSSVVTQGKAFLNSMGFNVGVEDDNFSANLGVNFENGSSSSQSVSDMSSSSLTVKRSKELTITANNNTAIGRKYWGPLSDLFVIVTDLLFYAFQAFDTDTQVALIPLPSSPTARKLVISTRDLLVPPTSSEASKIPKEIRKEILKLNPFVTNDENLLDKVLDEDSPVEDAVNKNADPNGFGNPTRATKVLAISMSAGSEVNYSESRALELNKVDSKAVNHVTTLTSKTSIGLSLGLKVFNIGFGSSRSETVSFQTTREMHVGEVTSTIESAKCYLIRNQNALENEEIEIYYDNIFGTFMFRIPPAPDDCFEIEGQNTNIYGTPIYNQQVVLTDSNGTVLSSTYTSVGGFYKLCFVPVAEAEYSLYGGDVSASFKLDKKLLSQRVLELNLSNDKRRIDLQNTSVSEFQEIFSVQSNEFNNLRRHLSAVKSAEDFFRLLNLDAKELEQAKKTITVGALNQKGSDNPGCNPFKNKKIR
ncbi:MAG: hypothetical protein AAGF85_07155 [Bacteroidota bacterium]